MKMRSYRIAAVFFAVTLLSGCASEKAELPAADRPVLLPEDAELTPPAALIGLWRSGELLLQIRRDGGATLRSFAGDRERVWELELRTLEPVSAAGGEGSGVVAVLAVRLRSSDVGTDDSALPRLLSEGGTFCWLAWRPGAETPLEIRLLPRAAEGPSLLPAEDPAGERDWVASVMEFHREEVR